MQFHAKMAYSNETLHKEISLFAYVSLIEKILLQQNEQWSYNARGHSKDNELH